VDFLVEDQRWTIRYLVVQTSGFFSGRRVLVSPVSFGKVEWSTRRVDLALTKEKVKGSPDIDFDKPVSRQDEWDFFRYYGYPYYWGYSGLWGMGDRPALLGAGEYYAESAERLEHAKADVHLRSINEIFGYHIRGSDETIGHLADLIVDDETWEIHYLVVDTSNWWLGKKVLLAPHWASDVSWADRTIKIDVPRQFVKDAPEWNSLIVNRAYEARLYQYHGRTVYWRD
jgi:sporulation protein YlmC with PRC-barrel domain